MKRALLWIMFVLAILVVVGIFVQVYLIASYIFGAGTDALDAHKHTGNFVHLAEVLVFLASIGAYWKRWGEIGFTFAFAVIGTVQLAFADGDKWVGGLHGLFALVVFVMAAIITHRTMHELGIGRRPAPGAG